MKQHNSHKTDQYNILRQQSLLSYDNTNKSSSTLYFFLF